MTSPALTVLMSVYNAERHLPAAIDSVLGQSHRDFRFVIVDDGSTDGSPTILQRYKQVDSRIELLSKPNGGLAAALNFGLKHINATYVARMDADDIALPERFARQIAFLDANPSIAVVGSRVVCIDETGQVRRTRPVMTGSEKIAAALPIRNCINHPSAMIRSAALTEAGGYREKFRLSQDYDLWLRLSARHKLENLDEVLLHYRTYAGEASLARNRSRQTAYSVCAAADFFSRKYGLATSEAAIDIDEPVAVTDALQALIARALSPVDRKAIYRHSLRLIRNVPGKTTTAFRDFVWGVLWERGEYGQLAKLALYSATNS